MTYFLIFKNLIIESEKKKESTTEEKADVKKTDKDEKEAKDGKEAKDTKEKKEPEATFDLLSNPARVMKPQLQVIKMENPTSTEKALYAPIKDISIGGKEIQSVLKLNQLPLKY